MVKIFGKKNYSGNIHSLGRKIGRNADVIGRKTINTIDKVAPMAATVALAAGQPEISAAIIGGQALAHSIDGATRAGVGVATAKQKNVDKRMVNFGEGVDNVKRDVNKVDALVRND